MSKRMVVTMAILGVLLSAFAPAAFAQGPQEGIKVHGHWVIDVRNPDGTLASHAEFENALMPSGGSVLAMLLGKTAKNVRGWTVRLEPNSGTPFGLLNNNRATAFIFEPATIQQFGSSVPGYAFGNLVASQVGATVVMSGSATATAAGSLSNVATHVIFETLEGTVGTFDFSGTALGNAVALNAGQNVQVTVTLSFS